MTTSRYSVVWTEVAALDVERLAAYLHVEAALRASEIVDRIIDRADSLCRLPGRGRAPPELRDIGDRSWLEIQQAPWRILYRIVRNRVEIHGVLDGRRDLGDILLERILLG